MHTEYKREFLKPQLHLYPPIKKKKMYTKLSKVATVLCQMSFVFTLYLSLGCLNKASELKTTTQTLGQHFEGSMKSLEVDRKLSLVISCARMKMRISAAPSRRSDLRVHLLTANDTRDGYLQDILVSKGTQQLAVQNWIIPAKRSAIPNRKTLDSTQDEKITFYMDKGYKYLRFKNLLRRFCSLPSAITMVVAS
ncbi:hypothetical protein NPIL_655801 [Nephila pilipes]|uniref:Uncharacterized protein n=1 Tax=Nephila pilipes TaxID=299642 RepID=A0A8X6M7D5_NEPPI|nr:hypothetical protein NPIL_655801 [Nephila pilipes]